MDNTTPSPQSTTTQPKRSYWHLGPGGKELGQVVTMLCGAKKKVAVARRSNEPGAPTKKETCPKCLVINEMEEHLRAVEKQLLGGD